MQRSIDSIRERSEIILRQLGNPQVFKLNIVRVSDVNGLIIDSGLSPGSTLCFEPRTVGEDAQPGVLVGLSLHPSGYGSTVRLPDSSPEGEVIVRLAEQLQEEVWDSTHGNPVPSCPGHAHPAKPMLLESIPHWVCPWDEEAVHPILLDGSH